jgi:hypothetical protein
VSDGIAGFGTGLSTNSGILVAPNEPTGTKYGSVTSLEQTDTGTVTPSFSLSVLGGSAGVVGTGVTFINSTANGVRTQRDFAGVMNPVLQNELRFDGYRRVQNYIPTSENLSAGSGASFTLSGATTLTANAPTGSSGPYYYLNTAASFAVGRTLVATALVTGPAGRIICLRLGNNAVSVNAAVTQVNCTGSPQRVTVSVVTATTASNFILGLDGRNLFAPPCNVQAGDVFTFTDLQIEDVTTQANQNPSEYVSTGVLSSPYEGAFVDGVQYFSYQNGNTVSNGIVIPANGAAIDPVATLKGMLLENNAATNYFLNSTAPVTQTISVPTGTIVVYMYGSGSALVTLGTAVGTGTGTATNSGTDWYSAGCVPVVLNITTAGTIVVTCTNCTFVQVQNVLNSNNTSSPIITGGSSATRAADALTGGLPSGYVAGNGWIQSEFIPVNVAQVQGGIYALTNSVNDRAELRQDTTTGGFVISVAGTTILNQAPTNTIAVGTVARMAETWSASALPYGCTNAGAPAAGSGNGAPTLIGQGFAGQGGSANPWNGWIRKVRYGPQYLTSPQLQAITASTY